jgi:hypothetical protein
MRDGRLDGIALGSPPADAPQKRDFSLGKFHAAVVISFQS